MNKCSLVFFGFDAGSIRAGSVAVKINDELISNSCFFKYLGVYWDFDLDWSLHINKTADSFKMGINMAYLCKNQWGNHPQTALTFYKSIIRSRVDWAAFLYAGAKVKTLKRLDTLQNHALRTCLGCFKFTRINVLDHIAAIPTLNIRRT